MVGFLLAIPSTSLPIFLPNMFRSAVPCHIVTPTGSRLALSQWLVVLEPCSYRKILRKTIGPGTSIFHPFQDMRMSNVLIEVRKKRDAARHHGLWESRTMCFCNIPTTTAMLETTAKQRCTYIHTITITPINGGLWCLLVLPRVAINHGCSDVTLLRCFPSDLRWQVYRAITRAPGLPIADLFPYLSTYKTHMFQSIIYVCIYIYIIFVFIIIMIIIIINICAS